MNYISVRLVYNNQAKGELPKVSWVSAPHFLPASVLPCVRGLREARGASLDMTRRQQLGPLPVPLRPVQSGLKTCSHVSREGGDLGLIRFWQHPLLLPGSPAAKFLSELRMDLLFAMPASKILSSKTDSSVVMLPNCFNSVSPCWWSFMTGN